MALSRSLLARFSFASAMRAGRVSGDPLAPPRHCSDYTDISISRPLQGLRNNCVNAAGQKPVGETSVGLTDLPPEPSLSVLDAA